VAAHLGDQIPASVRLVPALAVVTYLSVVLGELVPKALALDRAERLAMTVARPIETIALILRPVVWIRQASARVLRSPRFATRPSLSAGDRQW
jgi:putative hemolysin